MEKTAAAGLNGKDGLGFGRASKDHPTTNCWRWHQTPMADLRRVPGTPAPKFFSRLWIMSGQAITANDDQLFSPLILIGHWRGESFPRFGHRFARPELTPKLLAIFRIEREHIGVVRTILFPTSAHRDVALQHLHIEPAII